MKFIVMPLLLLMITLVSYFSITNGWNYQVVYGGVTAFLVLFLILLERRWPLRREWSMTRTSFWRDLKYLMFDAPTIVVTKSAFGWLTLSLAGRYSGPLTGAKFWLALPVFLLSFELVQYWYHRTSHRSRFLWSIHAAHHLPDRVYVVMHGVFHPINILIITFTIQGLLVALGVDKNVALVATLLIDLQSLISHANVDIRAGILNYIFVGPELHRYHHSANVSESRNFGNTLVFWDLVFGTFLYRPGQFPERLGVNSEAHLPDSQQIFKVLALPFHWPRARTVTLLIAFLSAALLGLMRA